QIALIESDERSHTPKRKQHPHSASQQREQQIFGDELPRQPPARRAQSRAHGELAPPRRRLREQQIGDVGAGHEQQQTHRRQNHPQTLTDLADQRFLQRQRRYVNQVYVRTVLLLE